MSAAASDPWADDKTPVTERVMRVCVETPLRGDYHRNIMYADACMLDALRRGEAPFLGHLLYPRVLNDEDAEERALGITAHLTWLHASECVALYLDLGMTSGMNEAVVLAKDLRLPVARRKLGPGWIDTIAYRRATKGF